MFADLEKAMFGSCFDENQAPRADRLFLRSHAHAGPAADHVIQFILLVGFLPVLGSGRQDVDPRAQGGNT